MPDIERPTRVLEMSLAGTPEEKAYIAGKHAGLDQARKEVVLLLAVALLIVTIWDKFF
ncbi:MAG: hypothetical protein PHI97_00560 [Desulfobulbus sp.]|jgi:hypothetical protein|nr:hypothetical protein [Desulfobulbus sp.]